MGAVPNTPDERVARARQLIELWAPKFGFRDYRLYVTCLPKKARGKKWADCEFNVAERWAVFRFVPDGVLPEEQLEAVVLHELSHGLFWLAQEGGEETACNVIVELALGRRPVFASEWRYGRCGHNRRSAEIDRRSWLSLVIDGLPEQEREVLTGLYWEGASLRQMARRLGVTVRTVGRRRKKGLALAAKAFTELESV